MKAIERIFQYIEFKGIKPKPFEEKIGVSNGYLAKQLKRKADLGESILVKIIENCPEISIEWLLLGRGIMIIESEISLFGQLESENLAHQNLTLSEENITLKEVNNLLRFKVGVLEDKLSQQNYTRPDSTVYGSMASTEPELAEDSKKNKDERKR